MKHFFHVLPEKAGPNIYEVNAFVKCGKYWPQLVLHLGTIIRDNDCRFMEHKQLAKLHIL